MSDLVERLLGALHDEREQALAAGQLRRVQELDAVRAVVEMHGPVGWRNADGVERLRCESCSDGGLGVDRPGPEWPCDTQLALARGFGIDEE